MLCKFDEHEMVTKFLNRNSEGESGERECAKCGVKEVFETKRLEKVAIQE